MTTDTIAPASLTIPPDPRVREPAEPRPRRWTREEFYDLARQGYFEGKRVLLLDGEIIEMASQGNWHSVVLGMVEDALAVVFPRGEFWVRTQRPLDLPDGSEPEPDVAIVPGKPLNYRAHPTTALLVVEVADSSLRLDRQKANLYASAGVTDYWIVNIGGQSVEVYRQPMAHPEEKFGSKFERIEVLRPGESISPLAAPQAVVRIADLLPPQPVPHPDA